MSKLRNNELPRREIKIKPIEQIRKSMNETNPEDEIKKTSAELEQLKRELLQIEQQQKALLENVQSEIEAEKENWHIEKSQLIDKAREQGFQIGYQEGERSGREVYQNLITEVNDIVDLVKVDYQRTLEQTENMIIDLAIHTAEKILVGKLQDDPSSFVPIVQAALREIKNQPVVSIYLHPVNYHTVLEQKEELKRSLGKETKLSLYINDELKEHSCVIEHPFGKIDASVDTQLEEIRLALKEYVMEKEQ
ncbi:flagellar assembly protein FliH [Oceanobacillus luteolus]|uniref:Flagellar assembly protein FliH n=1 Tax=Oceanobacillus luteolus TaxID=1274358 RepID=A0ABW4HQB5_9BACI